MPHDLQAISSLFQIPGDFHVAVPITAGHINDTYAATFSQAGTRVRYILQRINHHVFKTPAHVMENVERVLLHARQKLVANGDPDASRRLLSIVKSHSGHTYAKDDAGNFWRAYLFIEGAHSYNVIESPNQAYQAAKAFGEFQRLLVDLGSPRLHETIKNFHHTPTRFEKLIRAAELDQAGRATEVQEELQFALAREPLAHVLVDLQNSGAIPERITHNDTKLNNVLIDDATQEALCIIDLDTTMPGLALYDYGDMVRTGTNRAAEDERDLTKVGVNLPVFEGLTAGYLSTAGHFLNKIEIAHLVTSGKLLTFECGMRFLTDYLEGDHYFKIKYPEHNLVRCRNQFKLLQEMEHLEPQMEAIVKDYASGTRSWSSSRKS